MLSSLKVEAGQGHQTSYASNNTSCPKSPLCDMRSRRPNHRANEHQSHAISSVRPHPNTVSVPFFATPLVNKYWHSFRGPRQVTKLSTIPQHQLSITCGLCKHHTLLEVANLIAVVGGDTTAHEVRQRARCHNCGVKGNNTYQIVYTGNSSGKVDG